MNEADRTSIHEAMEQQTISISKAGIVTTLNARCSVIAAANPYGGRYDESLSFRDNVQLSDPIISRFDILNVIKDRANEKIDSELSEFVINQHMKNHPYNLKYKSSSQFPQEVSEDPDANFSLDYIKQYIRYAREKYHPKFT
jgi:DNA replication licensing factor MCM2